MTYRIGLLIPDSTVSAATPGTSAGAAAPTAERELRGLLDRRERIAPSTFEVRTVRVPDLAAGDALDEETRRVTEDLAAECDILTFGCPVTVLADGPGSLRTTTEGLYRAAGTREVVTSIGALVDGIRSIRATRVALVSPSSDAVTEQVVRYLADAGIEVVDSTSLGLNSAAEAAAVDADTLLEYADRLDLSGAEALVLSACVQLPSVRAISGYQTRSGLPVLSAGTALASAILRSLRLSTDIAGAGTLLRGNPVSVG